MQPLYLIPSARGMMALAMAMALAMTMTMTVGLWS
jgi:hypothetical protein